MIDGQVSLILPVRLTVNVDGGRGLLVDVAAVHLLDGSRMRLHDFPALSIVQLHPIIFAILDFAGALERLREQLAEVIVVGGVFESEVAYVAEILVEFLC